MMHSVNNLPKENQGFPRERVRALRSVDDAWRFRSAGRSGSAHAQSTRSRLVRGRRSYAGIETRPCDQSIRRIGVGRRIAVESRFRRRRLPPPQPQTSSADISPSSSRFERPGRFSIRVARRVVASSRRFFCPSNRGRLGFKSPCGTCFVPQGPARSNRAVSSLSFVTHLVRRRVRDLSFARS